MNTANGMDSVFAGCTDVISDFDVIFDYEDSLVDTVNGVNEAGEPLTGVDFVDLHQTQDNSDIEDVKDGEGDDNTMGAKNVEGTRFTDEIDNSLRTYSKSSDADDLYGTSEKDYQNLDDTKTPYTDEVEKNIEDSINSESCYEKSCNEDDDMSFIMDDDDEEFGECGSGNCYTDSIEDEIRNNMVNESESDLDSDVVKVDEPDSDGEEDTIDIAMGIPKSSSSESTELEYDPSDEDIIDLAINGD